MYTLETFRNLQKLAGYKSRKIPLKVYKLLKEAGRNPQEDWQGYLAVLDSIAISDYNRSGIMRTD